MEYIIPPWKLEVLPLKLDLLPRRTPSILQRKLVGSSKEVKVIEKSWETEFFISTPINSDFLHQRVQTRLTHSELEHTSHTNSKSFIPKFVGLVRKGLRCGSKDLGTKEA